MGTHMPVCGRIHRWEYNIDLTLKDADFIYKLKQCPESLEFKLTARMSCQFLFYEEMPLDIPIWLLGSPLIFKQKLQRFKIGFRVFLN